MDDVFSAEDVFTGQSRWAVPLGEALATLRTFPDAVFDSVVTDTPYGLGTHDPTVEEIIAYLHGGDLDTGGDFQGNDWQIPSVATWREVYRVLKPGAHLLSFGGTRTFDLISVGLRAAGFQNRDTISLEGVLRRIWGGGLRKNAKATLKPSWEPVLVFRRPLVGTLDENEQVYGTGGLSIDECRVGRGQGGSREGEASAERRYADSGGTSFAMKPGRRGGDPNGRWPPNAVRFHAEGCTKDACVEGCAIRDMDQQAGQLASGAWQGPAGTGGFWSGVSNQPCGTVYGDRGTMGRFFPAFYAPRATSKERTEEGRVKNDHGTVKPRAFLRYIARLVTPKQGLILDPFVGSGSTVCAALLEGFRVVGIDRDPVHVATARERAAYTASRGYQTEFDL